MLSVPLFVPSFNLIPPPIVVLFPIIISSIALFASTIIPELAVKTPGWWSKASVKYLPPIVTCEEASPLPSTGPTPIKSLSPNVL